MNSPELTRPIKVKPLPGDAIIIEADAAERAALATRFGISAIESLRAEITLESKAGAVLANGTLDADIIQSCAISGEDFSVSISEPVRLRFVKQSDMTSLHDEEDEIEIELDAEDCDEMDFQGDTFDLGEAVAQSLGLAIDPYAEGPDADAARKKAGIMAEDEEEGPLAEMLKGLKAD